MGLFDKFKKKKKMAVTVIGKSSLPDSSDGRYKKQLEQQKKQIEARLKEEPMVPHSLEEVVRYIKEKYEVNQVPVEDEYYEETKTQVKADLILKYKPELISTPEAAPPNHPPVSDHDPDYEMYLINQRKRYREASIVSDKRFPMDYELYIITVRLHGDANVWIDLYLEHTYDYLSFSISSLDRETPYQAHKLVNDILAFYGATEEDRKENTPRFRAYCNALLA